MYVYDSWGPVQVSANTASLTRKDRYLAGSSTYQYSLSCCWLPHGCCHKTYTLTPPVMALINLAPGNCIGVLDITSPAGDISRNRFSVPLTVVRVENAVTVPSPDPFHGARI